MFFVEENPGFEAICVVGGRDHSVGDCTDVSTDTAYDLDGTVESNALHVDDSSVNPSV